MLSRRHVLTLPFALSVAAGRVSAAEPAQDEDLAHAIGLSAFVWGYPMMDLYRALWETSLDPGRDHDRTLNEFFRFTRLITHEDDWVVTPNEDTIYDRAFMDLRTEPLILSIPPTDRQYWFPIGDLRHDYNATLSWDTVGRGGGNFALCAPGWQGVMPDGVTRVDVATPIIFTLGRYAVSGPDDLPGALDLQSKVRLVPFGKWGSSDVPRPVIDGTRFPAFTRKGLTDARAYFTALNEVQRLAPRPGNAADEAMANWLEELGMAPTERFDWEALSPQTRKGLERAVSDGHRIIAERMRRVMPVVNNWQVARLDAEMSGDPVIAAAGAMLGLIWNPLSVSTYDIGFFDDQGAPLSGEGRYVIDYDPPPPVRAFWSVTMYDAKSQLFVESKINRYSIGDRTPGTVRGKSGSFKVFVQHAEPTDPEERANWLPAPPGPFYLLARHYSPETGILTGDWKPPPIRRR